MTDMKQRLLLAITLIGCALAEAPYPPASGNKPQGSLLLLRPEYGQPSNGSPPLQDSEYEHISQVNKQLVERLRQEADSNMGSYHVYLADGRLQKILFTTAPLKSEQGNQLWNYESPIIPQYYSSYKQAGEGDSSFNHITDQSERLGLPQYPQNGLYSSQQQDKQMQKGRYQSQEYYQEQKNGQHLSQQYGIPQHTELYYSQSNGQENSDSNPVIDQFGKLQKDLQEQQILQLQERLQQLEQEQQRLREQQEQLKSSNYVESTKYNNIEPISFPIYSYKKSQETRILRNVTR